ncbi:hypothetical protein [Sphingomonas oryzagri]
MTTTPTSGVRDYAVRVDYLSGGDMFAVENFRLGIRHDEDIRVVASDLATASTYSNERIPDLVCIVEISRIEPDGPDRGPPSGAAIIPKCPSCGHHGITRDAAACWDRMNQRWDLLTVYDDQTCEFCGAQGNALAQWVPLDQARTDFLRAVSEQLGDPTLPEDPVFQLVIGDVLGRMTIAEAVQEWRSADRILQ